jgi:diaminopimelate decarboxylase
MKAFIEFLDEVSYSGGELRLDKVSYTSLLNNRKTPTILFLKNTLRRNISAMRDAFQKHYPNTCIHYALKASYLSEVCNEIKNAGLKVEILSDMEYALCMKYGFKNEDIVFNGCAKSDEELNLVIDNDIKCINCDSLSEIKRIDKIAQDKSKIVKIGLRVHPDIESNSLFVNRGEKLGIDVKSGEAERLADEILMLKNVKLIGINCHMLANETSPTNHAKVAEELCKFSNVLKNKGLEIKFIDIGGGFNSHFKIRADGHSMNNFAESIAKSLADNGFDGELIVEPGRYMVNDAFVILTKVVTKKISVGNTWVLVDAGTNVLIPTRHNRFHPISCREKEELETVNVGDGIGSTSGLITRNVETYELDENDYVAIINSGCYTLTMSENFVYLKPEVVMVDGGDVSVIAEATKLEEFLDRVY